MPCAIEGVVVVEVGCASSGFGNNRAIFPRLVGVSNGYASGVIDLLENEVTQVIPYIFN